MLPLSALSSVTQAASPLLAHCFSTRLPFPPLALWFVPELASVPCCWLVRMQPEACMRLTPGMCFLLCGYSVCAMAQFGQGCKLLGPCYEF